MSQADAPIALQACAIRLARLASDGTTPAGATNAYISKNLIKLTVQPAFEAGQEFTIRDACGGLPVIYKDRDATKRWTATLELVYPDPEMFELLIASPLITANVGTTRTTSADGSTTTGSPTITSASAAFVLSDVGNAISSSVAAQIPAATTILNIISPTSATMSANATGTSAVNAFTITATARSVGAQAPQLGVVPTDNGVSMELWSKAVVGGSQTAVNPWIHWAYPKCVWYPGARDHGNDRMPAVFTGELYENPNWGNGPFNDWGNSPATPVPTTQTLTRVWGWFRSNDLPTVAPGYSPTPVQA